MAKRFTDTTKWKDIWFQDLPAKYKLFWIYLLDECDNAGVWKPNMRLAKFQIGEPFEEAEVKRVFGSRVEITDDGYWFVKKFVDFQYGKLSESCKPHQSVIQLLKKHGVFIDYTKGIDTLKEKDKEKEEDKDKDNRWDEFKKLGSDQTSHFIHVRPNALGEQKYTAYGADGLELLLDERQQRLNYPEHATKFMRSRNGKIFNDIQHVWNDFHNKFIPSIYK